jgi:hypothetical protein
VACVGFFIGYSPPPSSHLGPYTGEEELSSIDDDDDDKEEEEVD